MDQNAIIFIENPKEGKLELVFTKSLILMGRDDTVTISFNENQPPLTLRITFIETEDIPVMATRWKVENNNAFLELNKWYTDTWVENDQPIYFTTVDKSITFFVKIRSTANVNQDIRHLSINLWKKNNIA